MSAEVVAGDPHAPDPRVVERAAQVLAAGALLVLPTETVYGLACRADDDAALQRLLDVKRRAPQKALAIVAPDVAALSQIAQLTPAAQRLAAAFMPGPITLVLRKAVALSPLVTGGRDTVGVRVPDLALTRAILAACAFPVVATSANLTGEPAALCVDELPAELREAAALIVDGGPCAGGQPSTVVDVTTDPPTILRAGPVTTEQITEATGRGR